MSPPVLNSKQIFIGFIRDRPDIKPMSGGSRSSTTDLVDAAQQGIDAYFSAGLGIYFFDDNSGVQAVCAIF